MATESSESGARAGIRDVARAAGVSISTVSNVLNKPEMVATATRERVEAIARELGYVPNASARHLRAGGNRCVGAVFLDLANPYYTELARGMEDRLAQDDCLLIVCSSDKDPAREQRYLKMLREQGVQAILVTPAEDDLRELEEFGRGTPVVLLDRPRPSTSMCSVHVDDVAGGALATRHLLTQGHRRIAFINGPHSIHACADRAEGMRTALEGAGLNADETLVEVTTALLNADGGEAALGPILADKNPPTAVFCVNDLVALGVIRGLRRSGVRIPDDVAVIGYDDVEFASMLATPLTSIRQPQYQLGRAAAELLLAETAGHTEHQHRDVLFQPELVVRETSRPSRRRTVLIP